MIDVRDATEEECCRMRKKDCLARPQILVMAEVVQRAVSCFLSLDFNLNRP